MTNNMINDELVSAYRDAQAREPGKIGRKILMNVIRTQMESQDDKKLRLMKIFGINSGNYDKWFMDLNKVYKNHPAERFVDMPDEDVISAMAELGWEVVNG